MSGAPGAAGGMIPAVAPARKRPLATFRWELTCSRCSHRWTAIGDREPLRCAKCKSPYWNRPRTSRRKLRK